jgi:hypothetical protein
VTNTGVRHSRFSLLSLMILAAIAALVSSGLSVVGSQSAHAAGGYTGAFFDSEAGDYIGGGATYTFPTVTYGGLRGGYPTFVVSSPTDSFQVWFAAPAGEPLVPGTYESAQRFDVRAAGHAGLDVFGDGRGCNTLSGRFVVDDATYDSSGNVLTFSARFESHCEGTANSALFGALSYNSTSPFRARTVSANTLQFSSSVGEPITRSVTLTNNGPASDDPTAFAITGAAASEFSIIASTCSVPLAANASCSASIRYLPLAPSETATAELSFTDELAPVGSPGESAGAGSGRFINLNGVAASGVTTGSITGTVTDPNGAPLADVCVLFTDPGSGDVYLTDVETASDGSYSINGLDPGTYYVYFQYSCDSSFTANYAPVIYNGAATLADATPVTVLGRPVTGVDAQLPVGGEILGHVAGTGGTDLAGVTVTAYAAGDQPGVSTTTTTNAVGHYTLKGLATGSYTVSFTYCVTPGNCIIQWYGGTSAATAAPVSVTAGAAGSGVNAAFGAIGTPPSAGGSGGSDSFIWAPVVTSPSSVGLTMARISGADAIATSVATSGVEFDVAHSAPAVVLARSDRFADALAGGPLAAALHGPLLITPGAAISSHIDPRVLAEIRRVLSPGGTVYILGGTAALNPSIDTTLRSIGFTVARVAGADQYATAVAIAHQLGDPATIFEATGTSFADALSAVPAAIRAHGAILLTDGATQSPTTAAYLTAHTGDVRYAIGGPKAAAGADPAATAVFGSDLYGTSAAVAAKFFPAAASFAAATGLKFPDALSGGVLEGAAAGVGPMLLVPPSGALPTGIATYLHSQAGTLTSGVVFGGSAAVSDLVLGELIATG